MPIDRPTFVQAQRPLGDRIVELLSSTGQAHSLFEIMASVEGIEQSSAVYRVLVEKAAAGSSATYQRYAQALAGLVADGKLLAADYQGERYYGLHQPR